MNLSLTIPDQHYSNQKLIEVIPDKKVVWLVTESKLDWIKNNKEEWTNTKMIFEISTKGDKTILQFTHEGLVPEQECYAMCKKGGILLLRIGFYISSQMAHHQQKWLKPLKSGTNF